MSYGTRRKMFKAKKRENTGIMNNEIALQQDPEKMC